MNPRTFFPGFPACMTACCLLLSQAVHSEDTTFEDGPVGFDRGMHLEKTPWQEADIELPAWPGKLSELIELNVSTAGQPFRVYIDPESLVTGPDRVVRYTSVLVSSSGVWNVSYEGLHCGERTFRRYAYGVDGSWRSLPGSDWQKISSTGINRYRSFLYENYFCDAGKGYLKAEQLVRKLRYVGSPALIED